MSPVAELTQVSTTTGTVISASSRDREIEQRHSELRTEALREYRRTGFDSGESSTKRQMVKPICRCDGHHRPRYRAGVFRTQPLVWSR